jgi:hypothetical protein
VSLKLSLGLDFEALQYKGHKLLDQASWSTREAGIIIQLTLQQNLGEYYIMAALNLRLRSTIHGKV